MPAAFHLEAAGADDFEFRGLAFRTWVFGMGFEGLRGEARTKLCYRTQLSSPHSSIQNLHSMVSSESSDHRLQFRVWGSRSQIL